MIEPKVSVILPLYNGANYLKEFIESILNQTFKDFEFIIIDDGSTDETPDILNLNIIGIFLGTFLAYLCICTQGYFILKFSSMKVGG